MVIKGKEGRSWGVVGARCQPPLHLAVHLPPNPAWPCCLGFSGGAEACLAGGGVGGWGGVGVGVGWFLQTVRVRAQSFPGSPAHRCRDGCAHFPGLRSGF